MTDGVTSSNFHLSSVLTQEDFEVLASLLDTGPAMNNTSSPSNQAAVPVDMKDFPIERTMSNETSCSDLTNSSVQRYQAIILGLPHINSFKKGSENSNCWPFFDKFAVEDKHNKHLPPDRKFTLP